MLVVVRRWLTVPRAGRPCREPCCRQQHHAATEHSQYDRKNWEWQVSQGGLPPVRQDSIEEILRLPRRLCHATAETIYRTIRCGVRVVALSHLCLQLGPPAIWVVIDGGRRPHVRSHRRGRGEDRYQGSASAVTDASCVCDSSIRLRATPLPGPEGPSLVIINKRTAVTCVCVGLQYAYVLLLSRVPRVPQLVCVCVCVWFLNTATRYFSPGSRGSLT